MTRSQRVRRLRQLALLLATMSWPVGCVLVEAGTAWCPVARAQDANPEELIRQGVAARRRRDDLGAVALFEQAVAITRSPRGLGQLALAEQALGRWLAADAHLREALAAADDPWVRERREILERAATDVGAHVGQLEVLCAVAGANLSVDGRPVGTLPLSEPLRVLAGEVAVEVTATGYLPRARTLNVAAGVLTRESIDLVAEPPPTPVVETPPPPPPPPPIEPPPVAPDGGVPPVVALPPTVAPSLVCEVGNIVSEGHCCWPNQVWTQSAQACVGVPGCPPGRTPSGNACVSFVGAPPQQGWVAPIAPPVEDVSANGFVFALRFGYANFAHPNDGLFSPYSGGSQATSSGGSSFELGLGGRMLAGHLELSADVQSSYMSFSSQVAGGGAVGFFSVRAGAYAAGHLAKTTKTATFDAFVSAGFDPIALALTQEGGWTGYAVPLSIGGALHIGRGWMLELAFHCDVWIPREYSVDDAAGNRLTTTEHLVDETMLGVTLGFVRAG